MMVKRGIAGRRDVDARCGAMESLEAGQLRAPQHVAKMLVEIAVAQALDTRYTSRAAGRGIYGRVSSLTRRL